EPGSPEVAVTPPPREPGEPRDDAADVSRPGYRLFSPGAIGLVAFLAGPVGAFLMLALNYWRLGRRGAAGVPPATCLLPLLGGPAVSVAVPNSPGFFCLGVPLFLALWCGAWWLQGRAYEAHRQQGGRPASGLAAVGMAVLGLVLYFVVVLGAARAYEVYLH